MIANWIRPVRMGEHRQPWATGPSTRSESMSSEYPPIFTTRGPAYCLDRAAAVQTAGLMYGDPVRLTALSHSANQIACGSTSGWPPTLAVVCRLITPEPALEYTPDT